MASTGERPEEKLPSVPRDGFGSEGSEEEIGGRNQNEHGSGAEVGEGVNKKLEETMFALQTQMKMLMEHIGIKGTGESKGSNEGGKFDTDEFRCEGEWTSWKGKEYWKGEGYDRGDSWKNRDNERGMILDGKHFRDVDKYEGLEGNWAGWLFNVLTQVGGINRRCATAMEKY